MRKTSTKANHMVGALAAAVLAALALAGCKSATAYHKEADRVAGNIIADAQKETFGKTEPFTIERPEETFRRRLIECQGLLVTGPESLGTSEMEKPADWPEKPAEKAAEEASKATEGPEIAAGAGAVKLTLFDALRVAAANSPDYQSQKENLFRTALSLDLTRNDFRSIFSGDGRSTFTSDHSGGAPESASDSSFTAGWSKLLENGVSISAGLALDLVKLLTGSHESSIGIVADGSISVPLLRGAGRRIAREELTQAERNVIYSLYSFMRYRRTFAVRVASDYLGVLQSLDSIKNAENNYKSLIDSAQRSRALADAGRLPDIQVDQARQNELTARNRWINARAAYQRNLDSFKLTLGLPTDANIELDPNELERLASAARATIGDLEQEQVRTGDAARGETAPVPTEQSANGEIVLQEPSMEGAGPYEIDEGLAIRLALENRLDLKTTLDRLYDAQRRVIIAADALRTRLDVGASGSFGESRSAGSADLPTAQLRPERGSYQASAVLDLPWERTAERNSYRTSLIDYQRAARDLEEAEDQVKLDIRNDLRNLLTARESIKIQLVAVEVAKRRVSSAELFLQAGRAETRDLLDAQESLVSAQDSLTANLVDYRIATLALQRDMGLLETNEKGLWREYDPNNFKEVE